MGEEPELTGPPWTLRRRAVFGTLGFGALIIVVVLIRWDSTTLAETLALGAFGLMGSALGIYTGAAAYEDVRLWRSRRRDPYARPYSSTVYSEIDPHV